MRSPALFTRALLALFQQPVCQIMNLNAFVVVSWTTGISQNQLRISISDLQQWFILARKGFFQGNIIADLDIDLFIAGVATKSTSF